MLALAALVTTLYIWLVGDALAGWKRVGLQLCLWLSMGSYFVSCWLKTGQTLASQTWRLKVVDAEGTLLTMPMALKRYVLASVLLLPAGLTFWWALFDKEYCFLHDRLLNARVRATD